MPHESGLAQSFGFDPRGSTVPHEVLADPLQRREAFGPLTARTGDPGSHSPESSPWAHGQSTFAAGVEEVGLDDEDEAAEAKRRGT